MVGIKLFTANLNENSCQKIYVNPRKSQNLCGNYTCNAEDKSKCVKFKIFTYLMLIMLKGNKKLK